MSSEGPDNRLLSFATREKIPSEEREFLEVSELFSNSIDKFRENHIEISPQTETDLFEIINKNFKDLIFCFTNLMRSLYAEKRKKQIDKLIASWNQNLLVFNSNYMDLLALIDYMSIRDASARQRLLTVMRKIDVFQPNPKSFPPVSGKLIFLLDNLNAILKSSIF